MYKASVTGRAYEDEPYPTLDSISFNLRHKYYQTNTFTTIEKITPQKQNLISITPSITGGYDVINKQWGIMVGVSVNLNTNKMFK